MKLSDLLSEGVGGRTIHTMFLDSAGISGAVAAKLWQLGGSLVPDEKTIARSRGIQNLRATYSGWVGGSGGRNIPNGL